MSARYLIIVILVVVIAAGIFVKVAVEAGSLTPPAAPSATMKTHQDVYNPVAGSFNASSVTASSSGNVLELLKCIIDKKDGKGC